MRFSRSSACAASRAAFLTISLAHRYHTLILVGIPVLDANRKSEAARFKTLIDTLYENGVKLLASADRDPDTLYCASDDAFEFERTISRLNEMGSRDYLARGHGVSADAESHPLVTGSNRAERAAEDVKA